MVAATFSAGGEGGACRLPTAAVFGRPCHAREVKGEGHNHFGFMMVRGLELNSALVEVVAHALKLSNAIDSGLLALCSSR